MAALGCMHLEDCPQGTPESGIYYFLINYEYAIAAYQAA